MENVLFAFGLTLFAGLSTGVGSALAFFAKKTNTRFLAVSLGFSAGVMIYVSMIEIMVKSRDSLTLAYGAKWGGWATILSFFAGIVLIALIDKVIPKAENPHELHKVEDMAAAGRKELHPDHHKLMRTGLFTALAIGIHNFPEGIATFIAGLQDPLIAIPIAVAIAIHNIPEGIAVSVPVYYATGSKRKAFFFSFLSGLSEPIGAIVGFVLLKPFLNDTLFGVVFGMVAGIMVYISLDELLPSAREYGEPHLSIYGLVAGMAVMAISLQLFV